jgi:molybdopterin/thiamine biosynthesis adenylyltransferase
MKNFSQDEFIDEMQSRTEVSIGRDSCMKLRRATVGIGGFGGVGALATELLARAGVGHFRLLDMDVYDVSNLDRQVFANSETIGRPKAEVAAERIKSINPFAEIQKVLVQRANFRGIESLLEGVDIGIIATDSSASQVFFHEVARRKKIPLVCGHTKNFTGGLVWLMDYKDPRQRRISKPYGFYANPLLRHIVRLYKKRKTKEWCDMTEDEIHALDNIPEPEKKWTQSPGPIFGAVANVVACLKADMACKYLIGARNQILFPHMIRFDLSSMRMNTSNCSSFAALTKEIAKRIWERHSH